MDPTNRECLTSQAVRLSVTGGSVHVCPGKLNRHPLPFGDRRRMEDPTEVRSPGLPIQMENPFHTVYMLFKSTGHHLEWTIQD
uniref:Uncharacterized protein n=1 Tax=Vitis vinifera TaxID=29760 RepID=F6H3X6_VITVI